MPKSLFTIRSETVGKILQFRNDRNGSQFHNPKDLAISLSLEASELLECFQWSGSDTEVVKKRQAMVEELSDILIYAVLMADRLQIDMDQAILEKLKINAQKYPIEKSFGHSEKYNEL